MGTACVFAAIWLQGSHLGHLGHLLKIWDEVAVLTEPWNRGGSTWWLASVQIWGLQGGQRMGGAAFLPPLGLEEAGKKRRGTWPRRGPDTRALLANTHTYMHTAHP